jgi:D-alanine-D-alanine ligase-like ATP-grasp enzyme
MKGQLRFWGTHVLAKSTYESASIGISTASSIVVDRELEKRLDAVGVALQQPVVVQMFVRGRKVETPVLRGKVPFPLTPVGISIDEHHDVGEAFLSFERVCEDGYGFYTFEEDLPELVEPLRKAAAATVETLQLKGFCRVDTRYTCEHGAADFRY